MTPVRLSKLSKEFSVNASSLLFDDSNSQADDDSRNVEWPFVEYVVSITEILISDNYKGQQIYYLFGITN